jgi:hypothetical protein
MLSIGGTGMANVSVFDMNGKRIAAGSLTAPSKLSIPTGTAGTGIGVVRIETNKSSYEQQVLLRK